MWNACHRRCRAKNITNPRIAGLNMRSGDGWSNGGTPGRKPTRVRESRDSGLGSQNTMNAQRLVIVLLLIASAGTAAQAPRTPDWSRLEDETMKHFQALL